MRFTKYTSFILAGFILFSCSTPEQNQKENDLIDKFILLEIADLKNAQIQKQISLNGEVEVKEYLPNWNSELLFLKNYKSTFINHPMYQPLFSESFEMGLDSLVVELNSSEFMIIRLTRGQIQELEFRKQNESMFSTIESHLIYRSGIGYSLHESNQTLFLFKNELNINTEFIKP